MLIDLIPGARVLSLNLSAQSEEGIEAGALNLLDGLHDEYLESKIQGVRKRLPVIDTSPVSHIWMGAIETMARRYSCQQRNCRRNCQTGVHICA